MAVCIDAMMVSSIKTTLEEEGESVRRGQEFGYFAFGSFPSLFFPPPRYIFTLGDSTIVVLFEKGDLRIIELASETLVRLAMGIGRE